MSRGKPRGFTLVEVLLALGLLFMVGVNIYQIRTESALNRMNARMYEDAARALSSAAAYVRVSRFEDLEAGRGEALPKEALAGAEEALVGEMNVDLVAEGLKKVTLEVRWMDARQNSRSLAATLYRSGAP